MHFSSFPKTLFVFIMLLSFTVWGYNNEKTSAPKETTAADMKLKYLFDMDLQYQEMPLFKQKLLLVRPYGGEEGTGYGEGDGSVKGPALNGKVKWVNHPHRRSDGIMLPNAHGAILTDSSDVIMFSMQGRTFFEDGKGKQLLVVFFETNSSVYSWLNNTLCVMEGIIDRQKLTMNSRVYQCIPGM